MKKLKEEEDMAFKDKLLKLIFTNQYLVDYLTRKDNRENNKDLLEWKKIFSKIDSIQDINSFKNNVMRYKSIVNRAQYLMCEGKESLLYGHVKMLYDYAGVEFKSPIYLSKIEHGINFYESSSVFDLPIQPSCYIFQGEYKKKYVNKKNISTPIYAIGPYIHYAKEYYVDEEFRAFKSKIKKTLLIFPTHTYEMSKCEYDTREFVDKVYSLYGDKYDTIMVCAYWLDVDSRVYSVFEERGAIIVSAGARFDDKFISRLKTIIKLSDAVLVNDIGTNIGYAIYLKKKVMYMSIATKKSDITCDNLKEMKNYDNNEKLFREAFEQKDGKKIKKLYNYFWGGEKCLKTPEEIKEIISKSEKKVKYTMGYSILYKYLK